MNHIINSVRLARNLNLQKTILFQATRMSSYLIQDPKYSFLKDLGLTEKNHGVLAKHGQWFGDGEVRN